MIDFYIKFESFADFKDGMPVKYWHSVNDFGEKASYVRLSMPIDDIDIFKISNVDTYPMIKRIKPLNITIRDGEIVRIGETK